MTAVPSSRPDDKVADALRHSWVYYLPRSLWPYAQLARWERPIGWQLLLWPCLWSATLAVLFSHAVPQGNPFETGMVSFALTILLPLLVGAFLMRGAGCTYNDLADIDIDNRVERTRSRPLPSGRVSRFQALVFLGLQCLGGMFVLLYLSWNNSFVFWLGAASLLLVAIYPFMKRVTWWPQLFLGLAFSWGAWIGWAIVGIGIGWIPALLYGGSILWVIGYDTIYAHQDREDDALIGVKSTARLFGENSKAIIAGLYGGALLLLASAYWLALPVSSAEWIWPAWAGLALGAVQMGSQIIRLDIDNADQCLALFKSNSLFGLILFSGLIGSLLLV